MGKLVAILQSITALLLIIPLGIILGVVHTTIEVSTELWRWYEGDTSIFDRKENG
jgi:hypothetical protein